MREGARIARFVRDDIELCVVSVRREPPAQAKLTSAEHDVYELLMSGYSNAEIAAIRQRAVRTVANQVRAIYRKLGVRSRAALFRRGVIENR